MKILLTGANGQLGAEIARQAGLAGHEVIPTDIAQLDITEFEHVKAAFDRYGPDVVVNAAAWTAVDAAEKHELDAFRVNIDGPKNLAQVCGSTGTVLVHYSTDYVFDGRKQGAYNEADDTGPLNAYGLSKLLSEAQVRRGADKHLILRTSWLFSSHGNNFVKTMLRLARERHRVSVVADQLGKPTSAGELARLTLFAVSGGAPVSGTYHVAQPDAVSWHGFAKAVFTEAQSQGVRLRIGEVEAVSAADFRSAAERPANSELDCALFESTFGTRIAPWRDSLATVIEELRNGGFFA